MTIAELLKQDNVECYLEEDILPKPCNRLYTDDDIGYVELINTSGDEDLIRKVAGLSHESVKGPSISKLLEWKHFSPFEFAEATFLIKAPIFVARQWMRHRTGKYMEKSLRYCESDSEFYINPDITPFDSGKDHLKVLEEAYDKSFEAYTTLLEKGFSKEGARAVLPMGLYTKFYFKMDMRNLIQFLLLRLDHSAQKEIRVYAHRVLGLLRHTGKFTSIVNYIDENAAYDVSDFDESPGLFVTP